MFACPRSSWTALRSAPPSRHPAFFFPLWPYENYSQQIPYHSSGMAGVFASASHRILCACHCNWHIQPGFQFYPTWTPGLPGKKWSWRFFILFNPLPFYTDVHVNESVHFHSLDYLSLSIHRETRNFTRTEQVEINSSSVLCKIKFMFSTRYQLCRKMIEFLLRKPWSGNCQVSDQQY